jgi:hypothetical protein
MLIPESRVGRYMHQAFLSTKMHQSSEANMIFYVILCSWVAAKTEQEDYQTQEDNRRGDSIQGVDVDWFKSNERW